MLAKISVAVAATLFAASAFALEPEQQVIPLKDGSAVYVFNDGKMGMEDRFGRTVRMQPGHVMESTDGTRVTMVGDEPIRVDLALGKGPKD
jgi:hypothetical protein